MNRKIVLVTGFLVSAALGALLPQSIVRPVEGSTNEATYQFVKLGMETTADREKVKGILNHVVGIEDYQIDPKEDRVTITFDKETMKAEWIAKSLDANGYTPEDFKPNK